MAASLAQVEADALLLSERERSVLAEHVVASLQGPSLTELELAWVEEAERRYNEYKSGQRKVFGQDAFFPAFLRREDSRNSLR